MNSNDPDNKKLVSEFWSKASCGESLYLNSDDRAGYLKHSSSRYGLEGELILNFADFNGCVGLKVLEIGVGLGADHQKFAEAGADLYGIDLTERAVIHTLRRLNFFGLSSNLKVGDAEDLEFSDGVFDIVYSWGVLHHSPDTTKAICEVFRVLKPGGVANIMIYHKRSVVGFILWMRYGLLALRPFTSLSEIYRLYLESPGTKAYTRDEAKILFKNFNSVEISTPLSHADLLNSDVGQRHRGYILLLAKIFWPRWLIQRCFKNSGLFMLIRARK